MPADWIGFHTCWPRNTTTMVAVPRFGKLLLLPHRSGTECCVPPTCPLPAVGRKALPTVRGCTSAGNSKCFFKPRWWEGTLPGELPSKRRECIVIDKRAYLPTEGTQQPSSRKSCQVEEWQMALDWLHPVQEVCTTDGYTLAQSLKSVYSPKQAYKAIGWIVLWKHLP